MWSLRSTASALTGSSLLTGDVTYDNWTCLKIHLKIFPYVLNHLPSLSCSSSSCVPSRFQTPSDSLVLKEGQSSSVQEPILASPASPLSLEERDEWAWTGGNQPPHGADNSDHIRLDSLQVRLLLDEWESVPHCSRYYWTCWTQCLFSQWWTNIIITYYYFLLHYICTSLHYTQKCSDVHDNNIQLFSCSYLVQTQGEYVLQPKLRFTLSLCVCSVSVTPLPRMQQCTQLESIPWGVTSLSFTITSLVTAPFLCRFTLMEVESGRVRKHTYILYNNSPCKCS